MSGVTPDASADPTASRRHRDLPADGVVLRAAGIGRRPGEGSDATWIWRGLDLALEPGELVTVRGATGAGKSLLLRSLAQLDPLDEGELALLGRPAPEWSPTAWRRRVAYLHQSPVLLPGTVAENLRAPFAWKAHEDRDFDAGRVLSRLEPLGRGRSWLERDAADLSGGERQILALLRTLNAGPTVLLLDEPTAALDPAATDSVETLVRDWLDGSNGAPRAVLWVTHDAGQARRMGRRRLVLRGGRLRPDGPGPAAPPGGRDRAEREGTPAGGAGRDGS